MDSTKWFKKAATFSRSDMQDNEKAAYSQLLHTSDDGLSSDNGDDTPQHVPKTKRRPLNRFFGFLSKTIPILFAVWGLIFLGSWSISVVRPAKPVSCSCGGTTVAEAISRGCKFTPLAIAWLPPQCLDEELAEEFDHAGPEGGWQYWADLNATIPLSRDEVGMLADTEGAVFYTTQEWHVMHCMYTWRKHYRSKWTGVTIERRSNGIDHIKHCESIVRDRAPLQKIWTMAGIELNADLA